VNRDRGAAHRGVKTLHSPDLPVTLAKVDHSVAVQWAGNPKDEFEVYRCESPTFEACSLAGRVQGTSWVDPGLDGPGASGTITFYKVVPRSGV
jgi:hypothetical protein